MFKIELTESQLQSIKEITGATDITEGDAVDRLIAWAKNHKPEQAATKLSADLTPEDRASVMERARAVSPVRLR